MTAGTIYRKETGATQKKSSAKLLKEEYRKVLPPNSIGFRMRLLSQLVGRKYHDRATVYGLTRLHWIVLAVLWQEDGLGTCAIAELLDQVGGTMTGVLDRMEERGLVRRERDAKDRRIWRIYITDEGRKMAEELLPLGFDIWEEVMKGISKADRERFEVMINHMIANVTAMK